jgi:hypothetical protein
MAIPLRVSSPAPLRESGGPRRRKNSSSPSALSEMMTYLRKPVRNGVDVCWVKLDVGLHVMNNYKILFSYNLKGIPIKFPEYSKDGSIPTNRAVSRLLRRYYKGETPDLSSLKSGLNFLCSYLRDFHRSYYSHTHIIHFVHIIHSTSICIHTYYLHFTFYILHFTFYILHFTFYISHYTFYFLQFSFTFYILLISQLKQRIYYVHSTNFSLI